MGMNKNTLEAYKYLLPGILFLCFIFLIPLIYSVGITFFKWSLIRPDLGIRFIHISNYIDILSDIFTWETIGRTLVFVFAAVILEMVLGIAISLVLNLNLWGHNIIQSIFLIPFMMAPVVVGFAWKFILNNSFGPLPEMLRNMGLGGLVEVPLLANPDTVLGVLIFVDVWQFTPFVVLVLLAGLKSLPSDPFEAAHIDGATSWQRFRLITLPLLKPSLLVALVIRTLTALRIFDTVSIMTGGGPGASSEVLSYYGYRMAFQSYEMGKAGTIGIVTMGISLILTIFYINKVGVE